ncbi:MAG: DUF4390 domain-containing protein [bacterium]|nr:DUF4390 domain-containing protein [bacterium]
MAAVRLGPVPIVWARPRFFRGPVRNLRPAALACLLLLAGRTDAAQCRFDSVAVSGDSVIVGFEMSGLFDRETFRSLRKGMTAGLEYQIQVWGDRDGWFDAVVDEKVLRMKLGYDNWERCYTVMRPGGTARFQEDTAAERNCCRIRGIGLVRRDRLKPGRTYHILVRMVFEPMSVESLHEIGRWLSGEVDDLNAKSLSRKRSPVKSAGDWLLGFVVNLSGFGDREFTAESPPLIVENGNVRFSAVE